MMNKYALTDDSEGIEPIKEREYKTPLSGIAITVLASGFVLSLVATLIFSFLPVPSGEQLPSYQSLIDNMLLAHTITVISLSVCIGFMFLLYIIWSVAFGIGGKARFFVDNGRYFLERFKRSSNMWDSAEEISETILVFQRITLGVAIFVAILAPLTVVVVNILIGR